MYIFMRSALRKSPAAFPRAVGEAGQWAKDGAADRTRLPSVWCQRCTMEAVTVGGVKKKNKTWERSVGFVIPLSDISV